MMQIIIRQPYQEVSAAQKPPLVSQFLILVTESDHAKLLEGTRAEKLTEVRTAGQNPPQSGPLLPEDSSLWLGMGQVQG